MNENNKNIYSEVFTILEYLDNEYVDKIPEEYMELFENYRNIEYNPSIEYLEENANDKTFLILAMLNYKFWATDEEKEKLKSHYQEVDLLKEKEKALKYNPDVFSNQEENKMPVVFEEKSRMQRIIDKIKKFFFKH